jgi:hypothetical protein
LKKKLYAVGKVNGRPLGTPGATPPPAEVAMVVLSAANSLYRAGAQDIEIESAGPAEDCAFKATLVGWVP